MSIRPEPTLSPLLVSPREAAKLLSVCEKTLWTLTKAGQIPVVRIGRAVRYSMDDLRDWIKKSAERA
jgi:excisionase family DNA binding protein